jgi:hypothetical protein
MTTQTPDLNARAIHVALANNLVARCPIHPDVLVAISNAADVPTLQSDSELTATVIEIVDAAPHFCPLCVNDDPE